MTILTIGIWIFFHPYIWNSVINMDTTVGNPKKTNVNRVNVPSEHNAPIPTNSDVFVALMPPPFALLLLFLLSSVCDEMSLNLTMNVSLNSNANRHASSVFENGLDNIPSAGHELVNSNTDVGTGCRGENRLRILLSCLVAISQTVVSIVRIDRNEHMIRGITKISSPDKKSCWGILASPPPVEPLIIIEHEYMT